MTSELRLAAQQALDALENHTAIKHPQQRAYRDNAIEALRAALEKKPVAMDVMGMYETERKKPKIGRGSRGPNRGGLPK